jgi:hypothetical protein
MENPTPLARVALLLTILLLLGGPVGRPALAADEFGEIKTRYFTIDYHTVDEATAQAVAGFADEALAWASDRLAQDPPSGLRLTVFPDESERQKFNAFLPGTNPNDLVGVVASRDELNLSVEQMRTNPGAVRASFRKAAASLALLHASANNLPFALREGLAQYMAESPAQAQVIAETLKNTNHPYTMDELLKVEPQPFMGIPAFVPMQGYALAALLADKYGWPGVTQFVATLGGGAGYMQALQSVYGLDLNMLQAQYTEFLPRFYTNAAQLDALRNYDSGPPTAALAAGQFAQAQTGFKAVADHWRELGRTTQAAAAEAAAARAGQGIAAAAALDMARQALAAHDYAAAAPPAETALATFTTLKLPAFQQQAQALAGLAAQGKQARTQLAQARARGFGLDYAQAQTEAQQAGATLAVLGDSAGVAEANDLLAAIGRGQQTMSQVAYGVAGGTALLALAAAGWARRRAQQAARRPIEEAPSWM